MKDKVWNLFSEPVFSFISTPIRVNEENVKEIVLSIDNTIIKAGFKYQVYELFSNQLLFDDDELKLTYRSDRLNKFWTDLRGENVYSILQTHQWLKNEQNRNLNINDYPASLYFTYDGSAIAKKYFTSKVNPLIAVYSNVFKFDNHKEQDLEIIIESYSDIWYGKVYDLENMNSFKSNIVDSKLNAPRLNSFLREIESELAKYDSKLVKDDDGNLYKNETTDNRILIEGEVIYQNDIDEG